MSEKIDEAFKKLKDNSRNSVDNLMKWVKDCKVSVSNHSTKLIDQSKEAEDRARKLFDDVKDKSNVELKQFKEVLSKLATQQKKSIAEFASMLNEEGPKFLSAVAAAVQAGTSAAIAAGAEAYDKEKKRQH